MPKNQEHIVVYVNDLPVEIYRGMHVKHALISCSHELYRAVLEGDLIVKDENGFPVGIEGSLCDGSRLFTVKRENP
ncbi:MAG: hypothetical protein ACE14T_02405 [Syntrophales bacterium]